MRCPECNSADYQHDLNFCPQCNNAISNPLSPHQQIEERSSLPMVPQGASLARPQITVRDGGNTSLQRVYQDLYQSVEAVERGDPIWEIVGKHLAAYKAKQEAKATYEELVKIKQEAYLEMKRQIAGAELARNHAQISDAILHEQLMRRARLLPEILNTINQSIVNFPEEVQADIIISFYRRIEENLLTLPSNSQTRHRIVLDSADDSPIVVNADEF